MGIKPSFFDSKTIFLSYNMQLSPLIFNSFPLFTPSPIPNNAPAAFRAAPSSSPLMRTCTTSHSVLLIKLYTPGKDRQNIFCNPQSSIYMQPPIFGRGKWFIRRVFVKTHTF